MRPTERSASDCREIAEETRRQGYVDAADAADTAADLLLKCTSNTGASNPSTLPGEHCMECRVCGESFDMRDLDSVLFHEHRGLSEILVDQ